MCSDHSLSPLLLLSSEVSVQSSVLPPSDSQLVVLSHSRSHLFAASAPYQSFSSSHLVSSITFLSKILPSLCPPLRMLLFLALVLLCSPVSKRWSCPFLHITPLSSPFSCPFSTRCCAAPQSTSKEITGGATAIASRGLCIGGSLPPGSFPPLPSARSPEMSTEHRSVGSPPRPFLVHPPPVPPRWGVSPARPVSASTPAPL